MIALLLAVVYPPPSGFDHASHAEVECARCHPAVAASIRPGEGETPAGLCAECHEDLPAVAARSVHPPAALRFGHRPHAARGVTCADCHRDASLPTMAECLDCHDGERASRRCATCHPTRPDGRLRVEWPRGLLRPADHDAPAFSVRGHGAPATADPASCEACHAERRCAECHDGRIRPLEIHPADYLLSHPAQARRDDPACGKCHRLQTFCVGCHAQAGITDQPAPHGFSGRRYHPEGFVDPLGGPSSHGLEARRNLRTCVSCHGEETCIRCHSDGATATLRVSPHPPGFDRHCGRALRVSGGGCRKCHTDAAKLERLCGG